MRGAIGLSFGLVIIIGLAASGCAKPNPLLGKWEASVLGMQLTTLEFTADGRIIADATVGKMEGTFKIEGEGQVRIVWTGENGSVFKYTLEGDNLTISLFGAPVKYTRMKSADEK